MKCDGTRAENGFRLSAKRTSSFKSAGASVHSTTGSRGVRISGSNAGYTMFRGSLKSTGYPLHSPVFPSLPLPCVTVCNNISAGVYPARVPGTLYFLVFLSSSSCLQNKHWSSNLKLDTDDIFHVYLICYSFRTLSFHSIFFELLTELLMSQR